MKDLNRHDHKEDIQGPQWIKRNSTLLTNREMQIKATKGCLLTPARMAMSRAQGAASFEKDVKKRELSFTGESLYYFSIQY